MTESYLVRLVRGANAAKRVVGEVEVVATGERVLFRDSDELLSIMAAQSAPQTDGIAVEVEANLSGTSDV